MAVSLWYENKLVWDASILLLESLSSSSPAHFGRESPPGPRGPRGIDVAGLGRRGVAQRGVAQ